jgi:hypothetical protein
MGGLIAPNKAGATTKQTISAKISQSIYRVPIANNKRDFFALEIAICCFPRRTEPVRRKFPLRIERFEPPPTPTARGATE